MQPSWSVVESVENNHGVLALQEAAKHQQQEYNKHENQGRVGCLPHWLWKPRPAQSQWLDMMDPTEARDTSSVLVDVDGEDENDAPVDDMERYKDDEVSPTITCNCWTSNRNDKMKTEKDSRSGMLLWTTKNPLTSSSTATISSTTGSLSSSSSSLSSPSWFAYNNDELDYTNHEMELSAVEPTPASDLCKPRHVWIVTTAALPWMTGTAVNPLLRAGSLWQRYQDQVEAQQEQDGEDQECSSSSSFSITLVLPWLCREKDREALYGDEWKAKTVQDQDEYIRSWLGNRAKLPRAAQNIAIQWYTAHYSTSLSSIFAVDDVCDACLNVPSNAVVVLEEPEHLNCYRAPGKASWGQRFCHVIGIVHTNYRAYAQSHASGLVTGPLVGAIFASLVRAYCDKVIKLSDVLQSYAPEKQVTCNVHGIRQEFVHVPSPTGNKVYFIGKLLWAKGLDRMLNLQVRYKKATGTYFPLHVYGSGAQQEEIKLAFLGKQQQQHQQRQIMGWKSTTLEQDEEESMMEDWQQTTLTASLSSTAATTRMPVQFMGRVDHAALSTEYKIFVNPSITEVLCTTTAEALAMGKFVIIPHHASNHFFSQFPNCLQYQSNYEFCVLLKYALTHTPTLLSHEHVHILTWEAATDRFLKASAVSLRDSVRRERISNGRRGEERIVQFHKGICKGTSGSVVRTILHNGDDPQRQQSFPFSETEEEESSSQEEEERISDNNEPDCGTTRKQVLVHG